VISAQSLSLRVGELPARLGDRAPKFARGLKARPRAIALRYGNPFINDFFGILHGFGIGSAVSIQPGSSGTSTLKLSSSLLK